MLELKVGKKRIYTCRYLVDSHVQNAQYCLVLSYVKFKIQNQVVPGYPGTPRDRPGHLRDKCPGGDPRDVPGHLSRGAPGHPGVNRTLEQTRTLKPAFPHPTLDHKPRPSDIHPLQTERRAISPEPYNQSPGTRTLEPEPYSQNPRTRTLGPEP